jgi:hypothetical protein
LAEAELINREGTRVRLPLKDGGGSIEIDPRKVSGSLSADVPDTIDPSSYDLVVLAMQEPQYVATGVRQLLDRTAKAKKPCMPIMNMPPLTFLKRIPNLATEPLEPCYTDASVWANFDPAVKTL